MITMQVMESEALKALERLAGINVKRIHEDLKPDIEEEAKRSYKIALGGMHNAPINSVYRAVKKATLNKSQRGLLTGSSYNSIKSQSSEHGVEAGLFGSWPTNSGGGRSYFSDLLENYLADIWGLNSERVSTKRKFDLRKLSYDLGATGGVVTLTWDSGGLSIRWPGIAKKLFKLEDMDFPSEPYETKKYNRDRQNNLFGMTPKFQNDMIDTVGVMVEQIWHGQRRTKDVPYDMSRGETAEVMSGEIRRGGGSRVEYDESLKPNIDIKKVDMGSWGDQIAYKVEKLTAEHIKWLIEHGFNPKDFEGI